MARLEPYFPKPHGKPRVDDRRVFSSIIFFNRIGLRWRDAQKEYGLHKTIQRYSGKGIFGPDNGRSSRRAGEKKTVMVDAAYLEDGFRR